MNKVWTKGLLPYFTIFLLTLTLLTLTLCVCPNPLSNININSKHETPWSYQGNLVSKGHLMQYFTTKIYKSVSCNYLKKS